ncbi:MAG: hypothetical protein GW903_05505 [Alphaproteobacteria bacterium]|nr:hypothetical protein [Alphaproteobacteria bacterium]NCQ88954.1 hypothetical protein [Alphaproteobacteria bacterium]NCT07856.1 hypothetical protein [Alphaproteobacteria bacterium]
MNRFCHILVFTCFLVGVIAPACGFSWGGKFSVIEICTAEGFERRIVENNQSGDHGQTSDQCQFCFQNAHIKDYGLLPLDLPVYYAALTRNQVYQYQSVLIAHERSLQNPRAPPPSFRKITQKIKFSK